MNNNATGTVSVERYGGVSILHIDIQSLTSGNMVNIVEQQSITKAHRASYAACTEGTVFYLIGDGRVGGYGLQSGKAYTGEIVFINNYV